MARPSPLSRPGPRMRSGLGPPHPAEVIVYEPTPGELDAENVQDAIDELYDLIAAGGGSSEFPRPLMAYDPGDDHWYVVVDGDGTAVMVTAP